MPFIVVNKDIHKIM